MTTCSMSGAVPPRDDRFEWLTYANYSVVPTPAVFDTYSTFKFKMADGNRNSYKVATETDIYTIDTIGEFNVDSKAEYTA